MIDHHNNKTHGYFLKAPKYIIFVAAAQQLPNVVNTGFKEPPLYIGLHTLPMCPRNIVYLPLIYFAW